MNEPAHSPVTSSLRNPLEHCGETVVVLGVVDVVVVSITVVLDGVVSVVVCVANAVVSTTGLNCSHRYDLPFLTHLQSTVQYAN